MAQHIRLVGLELEGGWRDKIWPEMPFHHDQSVPRPGGYDGKKWHYGEIVSPPLPPDGKDEEWLFKYYPLDVPIPTDYGTNAEKSAGFHIHLSFLDQQDYERCMSRRFFNLFLSEMDIWGKMALPLQTIETDGEEWARRLYFERLQGMNRFARRRFVPRKQVGVKKKDSNSTADRRTLINYCHALHKGTMEIRLFPTFPKASTAISALTTVKAAVNNYLDSVASVPLPMLEGRILVREMVD